MDSYTKKELVQMFEEKIETISGRCKYYARRVKNHKKDIVEAEKGLKKEQDCLLEIREVFDIVKKVGGNMGRHCIKCLEPHTHNSTVCEGCYDKAKEEGDKAARLDIAKHAQVFARKMSKQAIFWYIESKHNGNYEEFKVLFQAEESGLIQ